MSAERHDCAWRERSVRFGSGFRMTTGAPNMRGGEAVLQAVGRQLAEVSASRLLRRKIEIPSRISGQIRRTGPMDRIMPTRHRLVVLQAPAGFGKTNLLAECCRGLVEDSVPTAWISLDERDDCAILDSYIAYSCLAAGLGAEDGADETGDVPWSGTAKALHAIVTLNGPFVLALDDVDRLTSPDSITLLEFLLKFGPPNLHLAMTCRKLPAGLNIGGRVLDGHALVAGPEELRFSKPEIEEIIGPGLTQQELNGILVDTAGWPIAVRVLQKRMLDAASGNGGAPDNTVANWIDSRLFDRLEPEDREFLLDVGLIESMNAALLDQVLQSTDSMRRLETMPELNGLVQLIHGASAFSANPDSGTIQGARNRRRLHPLIQEHCVRRRFREDPERFRAIKLRASKAYMELGETIPALRCAVEAGDTNLACDFLEAAGGVRMRVSDGINKFIAVDELLRLEMVSGRPRLGLFRCLAQVLRGNLIQARDAYAAVAEASRNRIGFESECDFALTLEDHVVRGDIELFGGESIGSDWVRNHHAGLSRLGRLDTLTHGYLQFQLSAGYQVSAQFDAARTSAALARKNLVDDDHSNILVDLEIGQVAMAQGSLGEAEEHYISARNAARKLREFETLPSATAKILMQELALERNRLAPSPQLLQMPRVAMFATNSFSASAAGSAIAIDLHFRHEGIAAALTAAEAQLLAFRGVELPALARYVAALKMSLRSTAEPAGDVEREWRSHDLPEDSRDCLDLAGQSWREMEALSSARLRLLTVSGRFDEGRKFARDMRTVAAERGLRRTSMRALALSIALEARAGSNAAAVELLREFLRLFDETPYAWSMVRDHEILRPVVSAYHEAVSESPERESVRFLLEQMRAPDKSEYPVLSRREIQILNFIGDKQDKQIAQALGLSQFGVRYHIRSIFAKLEVNNRKKAVQRARELGLLVGNL